MARRSFFPQIPTVGQFLRYFPTVSEFPSVNEFPSVLEWGTRRVDWDVDPPTMTDLRTGQTAELRPSPAAPPSYAPPVEPAPLPRGTYPPPEPAGQPPSLGPAAVEPDAAPPVPLPIETAAMRQGLDHCVAELHGATPAPGKAAEWQRAVCEFESESKALMSEMEREIEAGNLVGVEQRIRDVVALIEQGRESWKGLATPAEPE